MQWVYFRKGAAKYRDLCCLLGFWGENDTFDPPTYVVSFDEQRGRTPAEQWGGEDSDHVLTDVVAHQGPGQDRPQFVALSEEGVVVRMLPGGDVLEDLPGAGLRKPGTRKLGYATAIRSLAGRLHVVGLSGQCWREGPEGWEHWEEGLLDPRLGGPHPTDIALSPGGLYAVGDNRSGNLWLRRAEDPAWREVANPAGEMLWALAADPAEGLWAVGRNGCVLCIDEEGRVSAVDTGACTAHFYGAAVHEGALWMASAAQLFRLAPARRVVAVETGLSPPPRATGRLQSVEGVLCSFGDSDILRLEHGRWTRLICPVSPPFG